MNDLITHSWSVGRSQRQPLSRIVHVGVCCAAVWAAALATQYVAARLAYHPHLGPWLYRASSGARGLLKVAAMVFGAVAVIALMRRRWRWGVIPLVLAAVTAVVARAAPLYSPERVFVWYAAYHGMRAYRPLFLVAWTIFAVVTVAASLAVTRLAPVRFDPTPVERRLAERRFGSDIVT